KEASGKPVVSETPAPSASTPEPAVQASTDDAVKAAEDKKVEEAIKAVENKKEEPIKVDESANQPTYSGPEWAKDLPKEAQDKINELMINRQQFQQWRSDTGRQAALQGKLAESRKEAEALRAQLVKRSQEEAEGLKTVEQWTELIKADPNLAKALDAR